MDLDLVGSINSFDDTLIRKWRELDRIVDRSCQPIGGGRSGVGNFVSEALVRISVAPEKPLSVVYAGHERNRSGRDDSVIARIEAARISQAEARP